MRNDRKATTTAIGQGGLAEEMPGRERLKRCLIYVESDSLSLLHITTYPIPLRDVPQLILVDLLYR